MVMPQHYVAQSRILDGEPTARKLYCASGGAGSAPAPARALCGCASSGVGKRYAPARVYARIQFLQEAAANAPQRAVAARLLAEVVAVPHKEKECRRCLSAGRRRRDRLW